MPPLPLPVLAGTYYGRTVGQADSRQISNVWTFTKAGVSLGDASDGANAGVVTNALVAHWPALAAASLTDAYSCTDAGCYALGSPLVPRVDAPMVGSGSGVFHTGTFVTAALIKHEVFRRGRGSQSASHLSPIPAAGITADGLSLTTSYRNGVQAAFDTFLTNVLVDLVTASPGVWKYVQLSKVHGGAPAPATYEILGSVVESLVSSQKRRGLR